MTIHSNATFGLDELKKEQTFRGVGATKARDVPRIDMSAFEARKADIAEQLWTASTEIGFFQLVNHGIPQEQIDEAFTMTERFFALPHETKARYPLGQGTNAGWEYKSQVRPSTGTRFEADAALPNSLSIATAKPALTSFRATRSCGRLGPASDGSTDDNSSLSTSVNTGSGVFLVRYMPCALA